MPLWFLALLRFIFGVRNYHRDESVDDTTDDDIRELVFEIAPTEPPLLTSGEDKAVELTLKEKIARLMNESDWEPPLSQLPRNRAELYKMFGDPGTGKPDKKHQRKYMFTAKNLKGEWNKGRGKLYLHKYFEPYLRQGLWLCWMILGYVPIVRLGSYSFRHVQHNPDNPLSDHSWASAADADSGWNRSVRRYKRWQRKRKVNGKTRWTDCPQARAKRGPVTLPYDASWILTWPKGLDYTVVVCLLATGITWGGTWKFPHADWMYFVDKYGVGYEPVDLDDTDRELYAITLKTWQKRTYIDPMHFEARDRQPKNS